MLVLLGSAGGDAKNAAHLLLGYGLREFFGVDRVPETELGPMGKPRFPAHPGLHFNLSHSGRYALCALSDAPVGVDIEAVRPRSPRLPERALSGAERRWHEARGGGWADFYTLWTRKESWCKYAGESAARPRSVCPPLPGEQTGAIAVHSFCGDGWRAAVCTAEQGKPTILWTDVTKQRAETNS